MNYFYKKLLTLIIIITLFPITISTTQATEISAKRIVEDVNVQRVQHGLPLLVENKKLVMAATAKAQDMIEFHYWAHVSPQGKTSWKFILDSGYTYSYAGENLAEGFSQNEDMISAWMHSEGHMKNILSSSFSETGVAVLYGKLSDRNTNVVVQMFASSNNLPQKGGL